MISARKSCYFIDRESQGMDSIRPLFLMVIITNRLRNRKKLQFDTQSILTYASKTNNRKNNILSLVQRIDDCSQMIQENQQFIMSFWNTFVHFINEQNM